MSDYQPSLLSNQDLKAAEVSWAYNRPDEHPGLTASELTTWKRTIFHFQQTICQTPAAAQGSLFIADQASPVEHIDPFSLPQRNAEFWRDRFEDTGNAALYFVVDHEASILLYVGETVKANQRWKGTHDCKRYILNYVSAHRTHELPVQVNIGFWPYAPEARKSRQALESELIRQWRSPFNKENWRRWATPFVGECGS
ncbi:GIY-YIG nuclease family protein [Oscillatoria sp. CS-180]|uniref:GIY-YIG nuclease family protein n=1 Tax=Oscillatoria sp. CS-180 TaxID=3021720 RepID=UPI00232B2426|nr:GIY-YIG nuclease family protein [Oscillatoria sp. CS-180]MDB9526824.1 GIY-YIG nuclease family protein [Oscillatoria sp. CS-180]